MGTIDFMKRIVRTPFPILYCGWLNSTKNFRQLSDPGCDELQVAPVRTRTKFAESYRIFLRTGR